MVNITHKNYTLRKAVAGAVVRLSARQTADAIEQNKVPKGNIFEFSRAAGLLAIKKTSDVIPDCHPLPVEFAAITYELKELEIHISVEVHTIYKTGVEVEAMHGAAITALTMYDMLKPIDKGVEINNIRLIQKEGGKSEQLKISAGLTCVVIVCSDSISQGKKTDTAGKAITERMMQLGIDTPAPQVVPDEIAVLQSRITEIADKKVDLILVTGGTGVSPRDITPEAIQPLLSKEIPGIMETARKYGQDRMPYAMLSRGIAGFINNSLVITLPGSRKGALETIDALFPQVLHVFSVLSGERHD